MENEEILSLPFSIVADSVKNAGADLVITDENGDKIEEFSPFKHLERDPQYASREITLAFYSEDGREWTLEIMWYDGHISFFAKEADYEIFDTENP